MGSQEEYSICPISNSIKFNDVKSCYFEISKLDPLNRQIKEKSVIEEIFGSKHVILSIGSKNWESQTLKDMVFSNYFNIFFELSEGLSIPVFV